MSVATPVERQRFSVSGGGEQGGIRLDVTVAGETGDFDIEVEVSSPGFLPGPELATNDIRVSVSPANVNRLRNWVRRADGDIAGRTELSRSFLSGVITQDIPRPSVFEFSDTIPAGTQFPYDNEFGPIQFQPVAIPDVGNVRNRIPEVEIDVTLTSTGFFGFGGGAFSDLPSETLTLPATAFVDFVEIDTFDCDELFSDIRSQIDTVEQRIPSPSDIRDDLRQLEDVRSEVRSRGGVGSLRNLQPSDLVDVGTSRIQEWRNRVREIPDNPLPRGETVSSLQNRVDDIRDEIQDLPSQCEGEFGGGLSSLEGQLDELEDIVNQIQSLRNQLLENIPTVGEITGVPCVDREWDGVSGESIDHRLSSLESADLQDISVDTVNDVISDIQDIPSDEGGECVQEFMSRARSLRSRIQEQAASIGCQDIPRFIRNTVAGAQSEARALSRARVVSLTPSRISSVRGTIDDARQLVEEETPDDNPCKDQLLGRLDSAEATVRRAVPEDVEDLSCEARFESIDDRLTSFEDDALSVEPPVAPEQFELFASRADNLINNIEGDIPEGDRCRRQFIRRVDGALNRVGRVGARARVITELTDQQIEERRQIIDDLRGRLVDLEGRGRDAV